MDIRKYRLGFRSKNQAPLIMFWCEIYENYDCTDIVHGYVIWAFGRLK